MKISMELNVSDKEFYDLMMKSLKEEVKNDNLNKVAEEDVMNPIITSRNFVKEENKMDVRTTASIDDVINPIITSETILSHK